MSVLHMHSSQLNRHHTFLLSHTEISSDIVHFSSKQKKMRKKMIRKLSYTEAETILLIKNEMGL